MTPLRLYCTYRPVPVAEVLEYVPAQACATCEAGARDGRAVIQPVPHAVLVFVDGFTDTVPVASLEARLEEGSPI